MLDIIGDYWGETSSGITLLIPWSLLKKKILNQSLILNYCYFTFELFFTRSGLFDPQCDSCDGCDDGSLCQRDRRWTRASDVSAGGGATRGRTGGATRARLFRRNVTLLASCKPPQTWLWRRAASAGSTSRYKHSPQEVKVWEPTPPGWLMQVGGLPTPDVSWYLDGKAIRPDDYHKMLVCEKGMHSFIIEIVTVHHAGVYECVARNRAGESRFTMRLDVLGTNVTSLQGEHRLRRPSALKPDRFFSSSAAQEVLRPPSFVQKMLNTRALEGDTVRFECKVDASPPPQLHWKKDKDMLRIDPSRMRSDAAASGALRS